MERSVENKVVVVTGGARGIGIAIVDAFLQEGARLCIIIDYNEQEGIDAVNWSVDKYGPGKTVFINCDVTTDLEDTYKTIIDKYEKIDVLVNNAGVYNENSIRQTMEVNIIAVMEWTTKFYDIMRKDRGGNGGTIINVSSIFGFRLNPYMPFYHASKFAVIAFSKSMGHEYNYKKTGVRVVVLCPGLTYTEMTKDPCARDDEMLPDLLEELKSFEYQEVEALGTGIIEIFKQGDSGTVWLVEGSRSAEML